MPESDVPKSHPRYVSLMTRERIVAGVDAGITSKHGLIAQGRGEAFDYLIGEETNDFARKAIDAALAMLLLADHPVVSVNGNVAALVPAEMVALANQVGAKLEVNIFHTSKEREEKMKAALIAAGAEEVLLPSPDYVIEGMDHNRRFVNPEGIYKADVVFVPLEDGDRCQMLERAGKKVITVDLNPKARNSQTATIAIIDNIVRAIGVMCERVEELKSLERAELERILSEYDQEAALTSAMSKIRSSFL